MKVAILGATRGMGRALARRMAERGDQLAILGRDAGDLERSAWDLVVRGGSSVSVVGCDLADPSGFDRALGEAEEALGGLDAVVVTAGMYGTQEQLEANPARALELLTVNFAHTVAFCESARRRLLARGGGTLCAFSSVAGERGRKPVVLYGASKAGLTRYLEGIDYRFRASGLKVVCVKPGFVRTGMTESLRPPPFAGEPDAVAKQVLKAIDRGKPVVYAPPIWALVMLVIRWLPRFAMRRIRF